MSRAPLLRFSPALGSSSYGTVRVPQDESEGEAGVASRQPNTADKIPNGPQRTRLEGCEEGPSSEGRRRSSAKRSYSSGGRRSSGVYTDGHNRRPSSVTSDVGMGADSKYSFATGLAVPGNPVVQETPASSPYPSSDDEEVLDIDDEDGKSVEEDPPDNSPYVWPFAVRLGSSLMSASP